MTEALEARCPVPMRRKACGRSIVQLGSLPGLSDLSGVAPKRPDVCVMHSADRPWRPDLGSGADAMFNHELEAMRLRGDYDFSGFVFHSATNFANVSYSVPTTFDRAIFKKKMNFSHAHFTSDVSFDGATFDEGVDFTQAYFGGGASFANASFGPRSPTDDVSLYAPTKVASFTGAVFAVPGRVTFRRVNHDSLQGFRLRALGCNIEAVNFEDVGWHRENTRIVLQDELDLRAWSHKPRNSGVQAYVEHVALQARYGSSDPQPTDVHGLIAAAYTRLVSNFDGQLNFDYAEDAFCGAMEMKRLDPQALPFRGVLARAYDRFPTLAVIARSVTLLSLYKLVSYYGSNYRRALSILSMQLAAFAIVFAALGSVEIKADGPRGGRQEWNATSAAVLASLEIASFQRDRIAIVHGPWSNMVRMVESIVIPSQLAIALLAVRRRFKR